MRKVTHTSWCDRLHEQIGTPECSMMVEEVDDGLAVMVFGAPGKRSWDTIGGQIDHGEAYLVVMGADGALADLVLDALDHL